MSRMIDRLRHRAEPAHSHQDRQRTRVLLNQPMVTFCIDNVAEYFFKQARGLALGNVFETWKISEFPSLMTPFTSCFFEFEIPPLAQEVAKTYPSEHSPRSSLKTYFPTHSGLLIMRMPKEEVIKANPGIPCPPKSKWGLIAWTFYRVAGVDVGPLCCWCFFLDKDGKHLDLDNEGGQWIPVEVNGLGVPFTLGSQEATGASLKQIASVGYPAFLAISFLHCKNVTQIEHIPNKKKSAYHRRFSGHPLTKYYTLEIDPMKKVLHEEGQIESLGLKKALHICRGHFANYTEGKGLFGKYHGQFWIPQHVKGSASQGIVEKDYSVKAPHAS